MNAKVIIVLPGTTGSTLTGSGGQTPVWPEIVAPLAVTDPAAAAHIMEDNSAYGVLQVGWVSGWQKQSGVYYTLLTQLATAAGGTAYCASPTDTSGHWGLPTTLSGNIVVGFPYDWRQDNLSSAKSLQSFLSYLNGIYGTGASITLVGHSMGGIVSRAYLEVVGVKDAWYPQINGLVTLGTPHLGAPLAFQAINGMLDMSTYIGQLVMDDVNIPLGGFDTMAWDFVDNDHGDSTFELLPPPVTTASSSPMPAAVQAAVNFITDQSPGASSPASYAMLSTSGFNANLPSYIQTALQGDVPSNTLLQKPNDTWGDVTAASQGAASLLTQLANSAYGPKNPALPPYYCIYGLSCAYPTSMGIIYAGASAAWTGSPWFSVDQVQGGDQIVPVWSATFQGGPVAATYRAMQAPTGSSTPPGSVNHLQLPGSPDAIAQIGQWLGL